MCCDDSSGGGGSSGFSGSDASFDSALGDGSSPLGDAMGDAGQTAPGTLLPVSQVAYLKASNTAFNTGFGGSVALSADGTTLAVSSPGEGSSATGVGGNQAAGGAIDAGAVYVFRRAGATWSQEAYVKASNTRQSAFFGRSVALSADGNTLAVGSDGESSGASGVDGSQADGGMQGVGAVYLFARSGASWAQTHYFKAANPMTNAFFGCRVSLSADATTLAVGARGDQTNLVGVNGDLEDAGTGLYQAGAAYVFALVSGTWSQQAYVKSSDTAAGAQFGTDVSLSSDGSSLAVGAPYEGAMAQRSGAAYTFRRSGTTWVQDAYVKASNPKVGSNFGSAVAFSSDATTLAVGSNGEPSSAKGIGDPSDSDASAMEAGGAYVFTRAAPGVMWSQQVFIKPSNTFAGVSGYFGTTLALASDGNSLVIGSYGESSDATGIDGSESDHAAVDSGAAYAFVRAGTTWSQVSYIKASNTRANAYFGNAIAISANASTLVIGSPGETSNATGIGGNQADTSVAAAGAVYAFR